MLPRLFALTLLLAMLTGLGPLSVDMYLASLPSIGRLLDAPTSQVQLTISAYLVGFACAQVFYGPLSDRHGRRPVLLAALGIYLLATLACALSFSIETLIAARFVQALGGSGASVLARAVVRDMYEGTPHRPRTCAHGGDHGAGAAGRAADRRRAADRVRLALELRGAVLLRRGGLDHGVVPAAGNAAPARAGAGVDRLDRALLSPLSRRPELRHPSRHRDLLPVRAVRLDLQRGVRAAGHLRPVGAGVRHVVRGRLVGLHGRHRRSRRAS